MHIKKWRKLAGEELNSRLKGLTGAAIVDAQVNEQGLQSLLLHLRTNGNDGPLEVKLEHGGYGSSMNVSEVCRPRVGIAEVELQVDKKVVFGFRAAVSENEMHIENLNDLDDQIRRALCSRIKIECAQRIREFLAALPPLVDMEYTLSQIQYGILEIKARLQNGVTAPYAKQEIGLSIYIDDIIQQAKESGIVLVPKIGAKGTYDANDMPF